MNKEDFIKYLTRFIEAKSLRPRTERVVKSLIRRVKHLNEFEYLQLLELLSAFVEETNNDITNMLEDAYAKNLESDETHGNILNSNESSDAVVHELLNDVKQKAAEHGIDIEMIDVSSINPDGSINTIPFPTSSFNRSNNHHGSSMSSINNPDDKDINYIPRRTLCINITNSEFRINQSFMKYLKEIAEVNVNRDPQPFNPYDDQVNDDDLGITIGFKNDDIVVTLFRGVSDYETFMIYETDNGTGIMYNEDFKYFKSQANKDIAGIYTFELDKGKRFFIGKKYIYKMENN